MNGPMTFTIEGGALLKCKGPGDVMIPEGVTKIGAEAFMNCNLTRVIIPKGVTEIGERAFKNWESLIGVDIPEGITKIGPEAFAGCKRLFSITIPKGVTKIEPETFAGCTGLIGMTIPESVTRIGEGAFYGCESLTGVTIPESVTGIGAFAFRDCEGLTSVTIPGDAAGIGERAFEGCWGLTNVIVSKSIKNLDEAWFTVHFEDLFAALIAPHIPVENFHPDDRPDACYGFAKLYFEDAEIDDGIRAGYLKYIKDQRKALYSGAVMQKELLRLMLVEKLVPWEDICLLLEECCEWNNNAARDAVLEYSQNSLPVAWEEEAES